MSNSRYIVIVVIIGIVLIAGVIMFGKSDSGEIDVNDVINNSNQQNIDEGGNVNDNVGTTPAALRDLPNGGLVPQDPSARPTPEPVIEDLASSTNASSTDEEIDADQDGEVVEEEESIEDIEVVPET